MDIISAVLLLSCAFGFSMANLSIAEKDSSSSSSVAVDVESLLAFRRSVSHDPFHVLDNWNNVLPNSSSHRNSHCNWTGIICSSKHPEYGVGGDVTSKGDVYSFGVVVLEVMTRRKPTNDMFSGNMSMLKWVSVALAEEDNKMENIMSIVEIPNSNEEDMKMIEGVLKLGTICCHEDPYQRPTMREVENLLYVYLEEI